MARIVKVLVLAAAVASGWALARPAPRLSKPVDAAAAGAGDIRDGRGRVVLRDVRAIEDRVFYVGSSIPSGAEVDDTAFQFLQRQNVGLIIALHTDQDRYYAEEGYIRYWVQQTDHPIVMRWLPVPLDHTYGLSDRSALHAAAEVLSVFKRDWPMTAAVYIYDDETRSSRDAREIIVATYELWRNRGWSGRDALWTGVERRFVERTGGGESPTIVRSRLEAFRELRRRIEFLGDL